MKSFHHRLKLFFALLALVSLPRCASYQTSDVIEREDLVRNVSKVLDTLFDQYNKNIRPGFPGPPVKVTVNINVLSIGPISEKDMELTMDCYFRQSWLDSRLTFDLGNLDQLSLNAVFMLENMWKPDTFIRNGRNSYLHRLTVPNKLLRIRSHGHVYVSQRLTIKAKCPMYLRKFPMDTQACPIEIGSLGYPKGDIMYEWEKIELAEDQVHLSQYKLDGGVLRGERNKTSSYTADAEISTLIAHFKLKRLQGYYFLQIYMPCIIIVSLSWVSFWINKEASPARTTLGVMTLLTLSTLGLGGQTYRRDLPEISYSTALDIYILACFSFVFLSLVEYAVINFAYLVYVKQMQRRAKRHSMVASSFGLYAAAFGTASQVKQANQEAAGKAGIAVREAITAEALMRRDSSETEGLSRRGNIASENASQLRHRRTVTFASGSRSSSNRLNREPTTRMKSIRQKWQQIKEETYTIVDRIDDVAKVAFPSTYLLFNFGYWIFYLLWSTDEIEYELMQEYGSSSV